jgi:hypothetical protein
LVRVQAGELPDEKAQATGLGFSALWGAGAWWEDLVIKNSVTAPLLRASSPSALQLPGAQSGPARQLGGRRCGPVAGGIHGQSGTSR